MKTAFFSYVLQKQPITTRFIYLAEMFIAAHLLNKTIDKLIIRPILVRMNAYLAAACVATNIAQLTLLIILQYQNRTYFQINSQRLAIYSTVQMVEIHYHTPSNPIKVSHTLNTLFRIGKTIKNQKRISLCWTSTIFHNLLKVPNLTNVYSQNCIGNNIVKMYKCYWNSFFCHYKIDYPCLFQRLSLITL